MLRQMPLLQIVWLAFSILGASASPLPVRESRVLVIPRSYHQRATWDRSHVSPDTEQRVHGIDSSDESEANPSEDSEMTEGDCAAELEDGEGGLSTRCLDLEHDLLDDSTIERLRAKNVSRPFARRWQESWAAGMIGDHASDRVTSVTLINGTPFVLKSTYNSEYQAPVWKSWPKVISPGQAVTMHVPNTAGPHGWKVEDTAAEVEYKLMGNDNTDTHKSVRIEFKMEEHGKSRAQATLVWKIKQDTKPKCHNSEMTERMERLPTPFGTSFLLAGRDENKLMTSAKWDYQDSNSLACPNSQRQEVGWMQQLLPEIGHLPLREIVLPRSHHSGLRTGNVRKFGAGREANAVTQTKSVQEQLRDSGVRVIDTRVAQIDGKFVAAHLTERSANPSGAVGESIESIATAINEFLELNKGELVIWDFHDQSWSSGRGYKRFNDAEKAELFRLLERKVKFPAQLAEEGDISRIPLEEIIGDGKSAVIIRFGGAWKADTIKGFPGLSKGFVHTGNFPVASHWSEEWDVTKLFADQLRLLKEHKKTPSSRLFDLDWVSSLRGFENVMIPNNEGLVELGRKAMVPLRGAMWNQLTTSTYPNWITVDAVEGNEMRSLVMAMNRCFAAALCGDWAKEPRD